jgi:peptidoglycan/xylan/chitin deacetylase (PgdA/CDA1 family)
VYEEITGSQRDIEKRLGKTLPVFCYPAGAYDLATCNIARAAGIILGFSTRLGHNNLASCDPLSLRRINVTRRTTPMVMRGRLSRIGIHADIWRHNLKQRLRNH